MNGREVSPGVRVRVRPSTTSSVPGPLPLHNCITLLNYYLGPTAHSSELVHVGLVPTVGGLVVAEAVVHVHLTGGSRPVAGCVQGQGAGCAAA
jgi:hypothetical protein